MLLESRLSEDIEAVLVLVVSWVFWAQESYLSIEQAFNADELLANTALFLTRTPILHRLESVPVLTDSFLKPVKYGGLRKQEREPPEQEVAVTTLGAKGQYELLVGYSQVLPGL